MGRRSNRRFGSIALAVVAVVATAAEGATLRDRARLREGPSKETRLLGWVEEGATVTIEGERSGWYAVRTADGQSGYVWQEHLRFEPGETPAAPIAAATTIAIPTTTVPTQPPAPPTTLGYDPRSTAAERQDVRPPAGGDTAVATELERLRAEISRLTAAQQELSQQVSRAPRPAAGAAPLGAEGSAGAAVLFFGAGALVGWLLGRFTAGRRERRSRIRI